MSDLGVVVDPSTLRFERTLKGPVQRVWDHLTRPELLAGWLARGQIELRVGGKVQLDFAADGAPESRTGTPIAGEVTRCEPPRALAYSWASATDGAGRKSVVVIELGEAGTDVQLVLTHRHLPAQSFAAHGAGWHAHLDMLAARLRSETAEPFLSVYKRVLPEYEEQIPERG